jgi:hypothetical protein
MTDNQHEEHRAITREELALFTKVMADYQLRQDDVQRAVELYYDAQKLRLMHANKKRTEGGGPVADWFSTWLLLGEKVMKSKLEKWVRGPESPAVAKWAINQVGIGPTIASGLAAYIDLARADTVSALWKFSGLAPGFDRKVKKQKLPYNARLKVLAWKMGESFVKVSGKQGAIYGELYSKFKHEEITRNETGLYKEAAARELATKDFSKDTVTKKRLESGMLTDGHLHERAKRRAVKIFLSHYWLVGRKAAGLPVTLPYAAAILGHTGIINPANHCE